ncbi:hypothetical protein PAHAL_9G411500 [Panicum hallii]|uniref:Uncharacterized protein n=1 Tax=Panicum hallii TaxID=206008 RepID=A0A2T8I492_9POAL|nr:hypothetical protein PAHAL_9G411500 [Panicum hallii]
MATATPSSMLRRAIPKSDAARPPWIYSDRPTAPWFLTREAGSPRPRPRTEAPTSPGSPDHPHPSRWVSSTRRARILARPVPRFPTASGSSSSSLLPLVPEQPLRPQDANPPFPSSRGSTHVAPSARRRRIGSSAATRTTNSSTVRLPLRRRDCGSLRTRLPGDLG